MASYGKKIRMAVRISREKSGKTYTCPSCSRVGVKRISTGIWKCKICNMKFASGSYEFKVK